MDRNIIKVVRCSALLHKISIEFYLNKVLKINFIFDVTTHLGNQCCLLWNTLINLLENYCIN